VLLTAALIIAFGIALRACNLGFPPFWVDEAESSINALTILDKGYPADEYLGLPMYENTFVREWEGHPEYAFDDISYSDSGFAVYHSWLPLYSMALSMRLFGIEPDSPTTPPNVQHGQEDWRLRTLAPRVPSVVFSFVFLVAIFAFGRYMGGASVGLTALVIAAFADGLIEYGHTARYYSATLALTTLCGLSIWSLVLRGSWRSYLATGALLSLMFHTHTLSFAAHAVLLGLSGPVWMRHQRSVWKVMALAAIVGVVVIPWVLWTGFIEAAALAPKAWPLLSFPRDLIGFPSREAIFSVPVGLGAMVVVVLLIIAKSHLGARVAIGIQPFANKVLFLTGWGVVGFILFLVLVPAASYFEGRMNLVTIVPGILLFALFLDGFVRFVVRSEIQIIGIVLGLAFGTLWIGEKLGTRFVAPLPVSVRYLDMLDIMRGWRLTPGTRLYSTPNDQLLYQYYGGLPVQSVAAVRREYFDESDDDVMILHHLSPAPAFRVPAERALEIAANFGRKDLTEEDIPKTFERAEVKVVTNVVSGRVGSVWPPPERLSEFEREIIEASFEYTVERMTEEAETSPIIRDREIRTSEDWWDVFLYRFSGKERAWEGNRNYAARIQKALALVLPWGWTIYDAGKQAPIVLSSDEISREIFDAATSMEKRAPSSGNCCGVSN
jgi:hypothetical protein